LKYTLPKRFKIHTYYKIIGGNIMKNIIWLWFIFLLLITSCINDLTCDVTINNESDYEVKNIKISYWGHSGIESKTIDVLQPGENKKETLVFYYGPVLMDASSSAIIKYYIKDIEYGDDDLSGNGNGGYNTNWPVAVLVVGGHTVFTIRNENYEINEYY
jgi:hypothetical protein